MFLSVRCAKAAEASKNILVWDIIKDLWNPKTNPSGYISLGLAENSLMHEKLSAHLHNNLSISHHEAFTYGDGPTGTRRVRSAIARLLTKHLNAVKPIEPSHICVTNGCSTAIEHVAWAFANPGDGFLLGRPYYGTFIPDISLRFGAKVLPVSFHDVDPVGEGCVQKYEDVILESKSEGQPVAGLMLCNPHNPLGRCYSRETMIGLMRLCEKYQIHFISDEIYALSVWENKIDTDVAPVPFVSALSIDTTDIIDPARVHVLWGMSKDFGANGIRIGAIISQSNPALLTSMAAAGLYSSTSSLSDHVTANLLEDTVWIESYIEENQTKLAKQYELVVDWANNNNIEYAPGVNAAFFLWVNLGKAYLSRKPSTPIEELNQIIGKALMDGKTYLASGMAYGAEKPGWFRIVFSQENGYLQEGLRRILMALDA